MGMLSRAIRDLARWSQRHETRLLASGMTEIRNFIEPDSAAELRRTVNDIYAAMTAADDLGYQSLTDNFRSWHGVWLKELPAYLEANHPELAQKYAALLDLICEETRSVFGPQWRLLPERSFFRRHIGMSIPVPWHVDADAAHTVELAESGCINVWMPLDKVGRDLPSLEIVPGSHDPMRKTPMLTGPARYRDDPFVSTIGKPITPILGLGDALVFDQYTLHRTQPVESDDIVRTACEFRFVC
jgi:hypothetical protein